jgi:hypothetical protein
MVLWHLTGFELHRRHKPMFHEFLQVPQRNGRRCPVLLHHGLGSKKGQHIHDPGIPTSNFSLSLSLSCLFSSIFI